MHQQPGYWNGNKRSAVRKFELGFPVTARALFPDTDSLSPHGSCEWSHWLRMPAPADRPVSRVPGPAGARLS
ncbi:hypothetical protein GCM10010510_56200 [Streptomyces anandii JCM 4720]|nr:hypothetical protein GCM10010510_56200 [Streptomyces anandii JCM 4720]